MVMSMTGYGIEVLQMEGTTVTIEIKSVNNRFLDVVPKLPRSLSYMEMDIKKLVQNFFHRGRIEIYITFVGDYISRSLQVDWGLMDQYIDQMNQVKERYKLAGEIPMSIIPSIEGLFITNGDGKLSDSMYQLLFHSIEKTCQSVLTNRESEGKYLIKDINNRIKNIDNMLNLINKQKTQVYTFYRDRIQQRIEQHIGDKIEFDQVQLLQEIALLAEKGDISEEITRLDSHIEHFHSVVDGQQPIGRKLDFILQEMHREINTIGAKSVDAQISKWVVLIKSEIEKVKEQVQNIE